MNRLGPLVALLPSLLALTGCDKPAAPPAPASSASAVVTDAPAEPAPAPRPSPQQVAGLPGIPGLTFGQPIPQGSAWTRDKVQASDECLTYSAPMTPHAYAIVFDHALQRISFLPGSRFRLPSGIAIGSPEAEVKRAYPGLVAALHAYDPPPARYLTAPHLAPGQPGLRFEIDADRKVAAIHLGLPGALELVEACA